MAAAPVPAPAHRLIILEDAVLANLASNPTFLAEFPFLASLKTNQAAAQAGGRRGGCGGCGRATSDRNRTFGQVKLQLASMDAARKRRLKQLLNTHEARIRYLDGNGRILERTF